jgi:hypothetical protein
MLVTQHEINRKREGHMSSKICYNFLDPKPELARKNHIICVFEV